MTVETEVAALTSAVNLLTSTVNVSKATLDASVAAAEAAYDSFDDRYLGAKVSAPSLDNDGGSLLTGALYFNSTENAMYVYTGASWVITTNYNNVTAPYTLAQTLNTNGNNVTFGDNGKAIFGAGSDLQIYHDGTHSYIKEAGTGNLNILANDLRIRNAAGNEDMIQVNQDGDVKISYDGSTKLATTSTGIDVTGTATMDGLTVDGSTQFNTGAAGVAEFYHSSGIGGLRVTGTATGSSSTIFLSNDKTGTPFDIYSFWGNGSDDSLEFFSGGSPTTGTKRLKLASNGDISFYEDTGTTPKLFWDASAESLGIGTSSPSNKLTINSTTGSGLKIYAADQAYARLTLDNLNGQAWDLVAGTAGASNSGFGIYDGDAGATRLQIDSSGNVGIGTSSPTTKLHIGSGADSTLTQTMATATGGVAEFRTTSSTGQFKFTKANGSTETMRIDSSGNLLVGKTSGTYNTAGTQLASDGQVFITGGNQYGLAVNRTTGDGDLALFSKDGTTVGSIGTGGGDLNIGTGDTRIRFNDATDNLIPLNESNGYRDNAISLGDSGARFKDLYLSGGVYLGGTGAANLLDDYEEGTWSPVYTPQTGSFTTLVMSIVNATYTKIGNTVILRAFIRTNDVDITGASGALRIAGLPFSVNKYQAAATSYALSGNWTNSISSGYVDTAGYLVFLKAGETTATPQDMLSGTNAGKNTLMIEVSYETTA